MSAPKSANAHGIDASQLVQNGVDLYHDDNYQGAIEAWQKALNIYRANNDLENSALVLENLARTHQFLGQAEQAIHQWKSVIPIHQQLGDSQKVGQLLTEQAQAHSWLGQHKLALSLLCGSTPDCQPESAIGIARRFNDHQGEAAAMGSLGNAYQGLGDQEKARYWLEQGLDKARQIQNPAYEMVILHSLGKLYSVEAQTEYRRADIEHQTVEIPQDNNAERVGLVNTRGNEVRVGNLRKQAQDNDQKALRYFEQSYSLAEKENQTTAMVKALLSTIQIFARTDASQHMAESSREKALSLISRLPQTQESIIIQVDLAHLLQDHSEQKQNYHGLACYSEDVSPQALSLLQQAQEVAENIDDLRAQSFVMGELGHYYECQHRYRLASDYTKKAILAAENTRSHDILYLWEWQTGRILKAQSHNRAAISYYERAKTTLESVRADLLSSNRELQFDFRDIIEPLHRQLITLYLENTAHENQLISLSNRKTQGSLKSALTTLNSLKLAELQNYFGKDCVLQALPSAFVDKVKSPHTATLSTFILPEQTGIILTLPNGQRQLAWINVSETTLRETVNRYRISLESYYQPYTDYQSAQKLYRWLILPFKESLKKSQVDTLVFIHDGILRTVPMAALHNGQHFLIQDYAIAISPSLKLTDPQPLSRKQLRAMILGLTEDVTINDKDFPALNFVDTEVSRIQAQLPKSRQMINHEFSKERLNKEMSRRAYPIVHIATHAQFSPVPEDTFLITGDKQKLALHDFESLLRDVNGTTGKIDLMTLTACQTAVGDDRAALGLAGSAIQAGVRSTLASLWSIDDQATADFSEEFYRALKNPDLSKAKALQLAQLALLKSDNLHARPAYWAPFILIGNWL